MSLNESLVASLEFNKELQEAIQQSLVKWEELKEDSTYDNIFIFSFIYLFAPLQHRFDPSETKDFIKITYDCLMQHLETHTKEEALEQLNKSLNILFTSFGIKLNEPDAIKLTQSVYELVDLLHPSNQQTLTITNR